MRRLIQITDAFLLSHIERLSRKIQLLTGWDCFLQARFCYALVVGFQLWAILDLAKLPRWLAIPIALVYTAVAAGYLWIAGSRFHLDDWERKQVERGFSNWSKADADLQIIRFCFAGVGPAACFALPRNNAAVILTLALAMYLRACDPLPPCRGKIRDWLDTAKLVPHRSPA